MPIRNAKRPTMITEGEIVGLTDKEKKVLEDAGIAGDSEIPEITLTPTSMDPISGTLTDDQIQILQNNEIVKFIVPTVVEACALKMDNPSNQNGFDFYLFVGPLLLYMEVNIIEKTFEVSSYEFFAKVRYNGVENNVQSNGLIFCGADNVDLYTITGAQLRSIIGYKDNNNPLGKYKIYEDTTDADTLVIEENW